METFETWLRGGTRGGTRAKGTRAARATSALIRRRSSGGRSGRRGAALTICRRAAGRENILAVVDIVFLRTAFSNFSLIFPVVHSFWKLCLKTGYFLVPPRLYFWFVCKIFALRGHLLVLAFGARRRSGQGPEAAVGRGEKGRAREAPGSRQMCRFRERAAPAPAWLEGDIRDNFPQTACPPC